MFSKQLQFLDYHELADTIAELGFASADLTVRAGGHVEPARVERDLPRIVAALTAVGCPPRLMATDISDADHELTRPVLETAAALGIRHYRPAYYQYPETGPLPEALAEISARARRLSELSAELGISASYQNHAGRMVGAQVWEVWSLLRDANPAGMGCQYDIRHATVEGGLSWANGLRLLAPRITTLVLKDVRWGVVRDRWWTVNVPLGEGMVDFGAYFGLLRDYGIDIPISLHCEYELGGANHGARAIELPRKTVFAALRRDLNFIRNRWAAVD